VAILALESRDLWSCRYANGDERRLRIENLDFHEISFD
jgi:hypothetical protein